MERRRREEQKGQKRERERESVCVCAVLPEERRAKDRTFIEARKKEEGKRVRLGTERGMKCTLS